MVIISNGFNRYQVYMDSMKTGNVIIVGISGTDKGNAFVNTPELYHKWKHACHYKEVEALSSV